MPAVCILVHGINISDSGAATVDRLIPYLKSSFVIEQVDYGWMFVLGALFKASFLASRVDALLKQYAEKGWDINLIGHSNGCTIIYKALRKSEYTANVKNVVFIAPALDTSIDFPTNTIKYHVMYSPFDMPTKVAKIINYLPGLSNLCWGNMGAVGSTTPQQGLTNYNVNALYFTLSGKRKVFGHSTFFDHEVLTVFGPWLERTIA